MEAQENKKSHWNNKVRFGNIKTCYNLYRKYKDKENWRELLFKHFHFSDKEIDIMLNEITRVCNDLKKMPSNKVDSTFLKVEKIQKDYEISEFVEKQE